MPRAIRLHAPGNAFHVTARTQGGTAWFTESLRARIAEFIFDGAATSATRVLAFAVMPNHLHIILRQGARPLGWMMQRVLQRTALLVRRTYNHKGHVFGARYWAGHCDDAKYLRQVIIYTHLNPYYAGLCANPADYNWTSHGAYVGLAAIAPWSMHLCVDHGLRLFASDVSSETALRTDYMRFITYWMRRPRLPLGYKYVFTDQEIPSAPIAAFGDEHWLKEYGDVVSSTVQCLNGDVDLRDRAVTALRALSRDLTLDQLRVGTRPRALASVRRQLIAMLITSGCRNIAIARLLNVSTAHVSRVASSVRR